MKPGFYTIMAAQFFSSLADNALLIAAIALLRDFDAPGWMTPLLKLFFGLSYVVLAAFVGAFADSRPKGQVMLMTNTIKAAGCLMMLVGTHPLIAYGIVGFGAAAYSPAKYGILTELLPTKQLVAANGWIEGTTVGSIIFGTVIGGILISPHVAPSIISLGLPFVNSPAHAAMAAVVLIYIVAALFNLGIPDTGARYPKQTLQPLKIIRNFSGYFMILWRDKLGQISLAVTTLFWGAGATLQFIVLKWAQNVLGMTLSEAAILQAVVALGVAVGAIAAASKIVLKGSMRVLPVGMLMGVAVALMGGYTRDILPTNWVLTLGDYAVPAYLLGAYLFLMFIGVLSGFFIVPMNALLQHRGHVLLSAGNSIAIQNLNENLSILVMLCVYALLIWLDVPITQVIILFGTFVCLTMALVIRRHRINQKQFDALSLLDEPSIK